MAFNPQVYKMKRLIWIISFSSFAVFQAIGQTTYTVNTNDDLDDGMCDGIHCSLREAINASNVDATASLVHFNFTGSTQINLTTSLPPLADTTTTIDGTTAVGDIIIDGTAITSGASGLTIEADKATILGLQLQNFNDAIVIGNFATTPIKDITIGAPGKENIIVSNIVGITAAQPNAFIENLKIQSNYIGTNLSFANLPNNNGINITGSGHNNVLIGGDYNLGEGNFICHNIDHGILAESNTIIFGNRIGTGLLGTEVLGNGFYGVKVGNDCTVGAIYTGFRNSIAYNGVAGITSYCSSCADNTYSGNRIYCNQSKGIENIGNGGIPAPIITSNTGSSISGTAVPFSDIQLFNEPSNCGTPCQGYDFLGIAVADASGNWALSDFYYTGKITATATDGNGNTSEFSACFSPDECIDAIALPIETIECINTYIDLQTDDATSSPEPLNDCINFAPNGARDIWAKAMVPSTGALMVQLQAATSTIDAMVEVYTGSCTSLNFIKCDSLFTASHAFPVDQLIPNTMVYFRIFDQFDINTGVVSIGLRELPTTPSEWTLCYDAVEDRKANEFIIQYTTDATPAEILAIENELIAAGAQLVDECNCSYKPLQLWEASDPIEVEERRKISRSKAKADTTSYNFIVGDQICQEPFYSSQTVYFPGNPGETGIVLSLDYYTTANCTQSGIFESLPASPYNPMAWTKRVNVAVIDTGVEDTHDYIENAIWNNPESNDSDNCVTNDLIGYDFKNKDATPDDVDGHGTSMNGVIAGNFPNDIKLDLMNVKFIENEKSTLFEAVCAMYYAIDNGAKVMNLSWGFIASEGIPAILEEVLDYAKQKDVLVITSAGNRGLNNDTTEKFPANYSNTNSIAVAAYEQEMGSDPVLSPYSNYGANKVDLAALGYVETATLGNNTEALAGTSIAAPLVSRTAAIIRACYPMLSAAEVKTCILSSVDVYGTLGGLVATSGILNQDAALLCAYSFALSKCNNSNVMLTATHTIDSLVLSDASIFSDALVTINTDITYKAGISIELLSDFEVELGAEFLATIEGCSGTILPPFTSHSNEFSLIQNENELLIDLVDTALYDFTTITLTDVNGKIVSIQNLSIAQPSIDTATLTKGVYFLQISTNKFSKTKKIVIK